MAIQSTKTIFSEDFSSPKSVAKNGGTITGSPVFQGGLRFDGSADYVTYSVPNTLLAKKEITFVVEFVPDFDFDYNDIINLYSSTSDHYRVYKHNNAGNNVLGVAVGGTLIQEITSAVYSPYWNVGKRNVLVVAAVSASTNAWLNGVQILTTDVTTFTPTFPTELVIGARANGTGKFDGTIKSFSIHNRLFTASEAMALYDNSLFNFENKADVWLDMKAQVGEPSDNELLVDWDMEKEGVTDWGVHTDATLSKSTEDPYAGARSLRITATAQAGGQVPQTSQTVFVSGSRYQVSGWARSDGTRIPLITNTGVGNQFTGTTDTEWQYFSYVFTAGATGIILYYSVTDPDGSEYVEFDNVSVQLYIEQTTKDKSGNGKNFVLDGVTFQAPGFLFDGVNDKIDPSLDAPTGTYTVAYKKRNEAAAFESDLTTWNLIKSAGSFSGTLDYLAVFPFTLTPIQEEFLSSQWEGVR